MKSETLQSALNETAKMNTQLDGSEKKHLEQMNEIVRLKDDLNKSGSIVQS